MLKILASDKIYISNSKIQSAGRGVFALKIIKKGEVIEICPLIDIPKGDLAGLNESILVTYFFFFGKHKERLAVALGFGSIYNHARTPNTKYKIKPKVNTIEFIALKDIKKDEEITVNYNFGSPKDIKPLWFE